MNVEAYRAILQRLGVEPAVSRDNAEAVNPVPASTPSQEAEALALLAPARTLRLDPETVREVLGPKPELHDIACIRFDVLATVRRLETEIQNGVIPPGVRLVRGRPLADWLDLDEVARLLRAWRDGR